MERKVVFFIACLIGIFLPSCAQETIFDRLSVQQVGEGRVTIHQDSRLEELVGKPQGVNGEGNLQRTQQKVSGFRVQVYAGNNSQKARSEAHRMAEKVKTLFPDMTVYSQFVSPRWLCRVGDYRSIEEADAVMRQLKATGEFKEVSIVRSLVVF